MPFPHDQVNDDITVTVTITRRPGRNWGNQPSTPASTQTITRGRSCTDSTDDAYTAWQMAQAIAWEIVEAMGDPLRAPAHGQPAPFAVPASAVADHQATTAVRRSWSRIVRAARAHDATAAAMLERATDRQVHNGVLTVTLPNWKAADILTESVRSNPAALLHAITSHLPDVAVQHVAVVAPGDRPDPLPAPAVTASE